MEDDSSYNSEAEPDSDTEESLGVDDPEALLQTWLGELDSLNMVSTEYRWLPMRLDYLLCHSVPKCPEKDHANRHGSNILRQYHHNNFY